MDTQMLLLVCTLLCFLPVYNGDESCDGIIRELEIVPKFTSDVKSTELEVFFAGYRFKCGEEHELHATKYPPVCTLCSKVDPQCDLMSLVFFSTDPAYIHWIVYNIPAENMKQGFLDDWGSLGANYNPPTSSNETDSYVLFVYCQQFPVTQMNPGYFEDTSHRKNFPIQAHARYYGLGVPELAVSFKLTPD